MTTSIISNKEMEYIMEVVKSLEESGLLIKGISETIQNEAKEQKGGFLRTLLDTLAASMFKNMLAGKSKTPGQGASEGVIRNES